MTEFCPTPWPEEPTPNHLKNCKECGLYKHGTRMIWGEGNPNASLMVILDNPGARENKEGEQYVCGTRQTLQEAAYEVGLNNQDMYITYILKRRPRKAYDKERARKICIRHLEQQLENRKPVLLICLGNVAVQSFFQNAEVEVKQLRGKIHHINGFSTIVAYHPLAIRRRPNLRSGFVDDWQLAVDYMNNRSF